MTLANRYQLGWFSTGRDQAARDLLTTVNNAIQRGEIEAEIAFVFCNREPGESAESDSFIKLVQGYHIPLVYFSSHKFQVNHRTPAHEPPGTLNAWKRDYDRELIKRLADFTPDLCVMAGYMLIISPELCQRYPIVNLHPAVPGGPKGTWQEVIWQLIDNEAKQTGAMMHLVTPELDRGPAVAYCTFSIRGEPFDHYWQEIKRLPAESAAKLKARDSLFQLIRQHELSREFPLIVATLKAFSQGKIRINKEKQVVDAQGKPIKGYNLTEEIDQELKGATA